MTKKRLATIVAGLFILIGLSYHRLTQSPLTEPEGSLHLNGVTMGTTYTVKVHGEGDSDELQEAIDEVLEAVNAGMSTYREGSELSRFNTAQADVPFVLSTDTFNVINVSLEIARETGGVFDITVGAAVNAYGFGPEFDLDLPTDDELTSMSEFVGYEHLRLDAEAHTVTKDHEDVYSDLSAIAKGYGVDKVAELLEYRGYENYFVEVGGEVRTHGGNSTESHHWTIGIERPDPERRSIYKAIPLRNIAMATSGNYRNFADIDGVRVSHTIDPRTLKPIEHTILSASVLHESCMEADAWATTLMVLGPRAGLHFAEETGLAVLLLSEGDDGELVERTSWAWKKYMDAE